MMDEQFIAPKIITRLVPQIVVFTFSCSIVYIIFFHNIYTLLWYRSLGGTNPFSALKNALVPEISASPLFDLLTGIICRRRPLELSQRPSFTINVAVQPFPTPSLSSQMCPPMRFMNLNAPVEM